MATTTSITTTYAGEFAGKYIMAALLQSETLSKGLITVKPNVKFKEVLKPVTLSGLIADATCDFTSTGTVTLTERILQPKELQVNLELCKTPFRSDWDAIKMGYSAFDVIPKNFSDFFIAKISESTGAQTERDIWQGVAATAGQFGGFNAILTTDAGLPAAQEVVGTTVTAANVITELRKLIAEIPTRLLYYPNTAIYVPQNIALAYLQALGGYGASGLGSNGLGANGPMWYNNQSLFIDGIPIIVSKGMADNTAVFTYKENLIFGTGMMSDHNLVKVLDMEDLDGSQNVRYIQRYTAGVQIAIIQDVVTYGLPNAAN